LKRRDSDERERGGGGGRGRGAKKDDKDKKGERPRGGFFRRRRVCKFCAEKIDYINYKDVRLLSPFIPERGKIQPRRISGHLRQAPALAAGRDRARAPARLDSVRN
jgi:ribosomal protein S18